MSGFYTGKLACGCVVAACIDYPDNPEALERCLSEYREAGYTVEFVTMPKGQGFQVPGCTCTPGKKLLAQIDALGWPEGLTTADRYTRREDDTPRGGIAVCFGNDGDAHIAIMPDPDQPSYNARFRAGGGGGGGRSKWTRRALMLLAIAIQADNQENPQ